jgi:hypothetical protein
VEPFFTSSERLKIKPLFNQALLVYVSCGVRQKIFSQGIAAKAVAAVGAQKHTGGCLLRGQGKSPAGARAKKHSAPRRNQLLEGFLQFSLL